LRQENVDEKGKKTNLLNLFGHSELDGVGDELGVLFDDLLDLLLLQVLELVLLEEESDFSTTTERRIDSVGGDGESTTSSRLPNVLFIVVVLGDNLHTFGNKIGGVETNTELTNHGNISTRAESLHETLMRSDVRSFLSTKAQHREGAYLGAGLGNGTKVVDQIGFGHTNTGITDAENLVLLIGDEEDMEILLSVEDRGIGQGGIADFIESIRGIRDYFTKKDLLVRVEGI
jgi:hypothetical protein